MLWVLLPLHILIILYIMAYLLMYFACRLTLGEGKTISTYLLLHPQLIEHQLHTVKPQSASIEMMHKWIK